MTVNDGMWDKRYETEGYYFGKSPADFLVAQAHHIPERSRVLCVADGEGRNSVYLARAGHAVVAFDASALGVAKARRLSQEAGVDVAFHVKGVEDWDWNSVHDAVVAIFVQFAPPKMRAAMFEGMARAVRPGGVLLLHGYAPRQVEYGTGGPPWPEHMYTEDLLRDAFKGWEVVRLADYDAVIDEGEGHSGRSALVDFVARKPVA